MIIIGHLLLAFITWGLFRNREHVRTGAPFWVHWATCTPIHVIAGYVSFFWIAGGTIAAFQGELLPAAFLIVSFLIYVAALVVYTFPEYQAFVDRRTRANPYAGPWPQMWVSERCIIGERMVTVEDSSVGDGISRRPRTINYKAENTR